MSEEQKPKNDSMPNFETKDGKKYEVPVNGSLGLLALGDIGLIAWRKRRIQYQQDMINAQKQKK